MDKSSVGSAVVLADRIALNQVYLSTEPSQRRLAVSSLLKKDCGQQLPRRIVIVVGSGASNAACGLPTGPEAADRLTDKVKGKVAPELIEQEKHRVTLEYRLEKNDFEAVLLALSKFDQPAVLAELGTIFNRRHHPWLGYEILGHLLKHRFIDALVNFNFDEILDQAVDDELGSDGYYKVILDGDCPSDPADWLDNDRDRFRFPLYIKPHGTASHQSSMRFTQPSYSLLPHGLSNLLETLFDYDRLCLVVIGHALQSVEFNDLLFRRQRKHLDVFFIDKARPQLRRPGPGAAVEQSIGKSTVTYLHAPPPNGLENRLHQLWGLVHGRFHERSKPRGIERHILLSKLFRRTADLNVRQAEARELVRKYLEDRVYVEIALAIAKAKGFVSVDHLAHGRVGPYYRMYRRAAEAANEVPSLVTMCCNLGLEPIGYSRNTLSLPSVGRGDRLDERERLRRPILEEEEFKLAAVQLAARTYDRLTNDLKARAGLRGKELVPTLRTMYRGEEVEVSASLEAFATDVFSRPKLLPTLTAVHNETRRLLQSSALWDSIVCTAESGEWLTRKEWVDEIRKRPDSRLALIVADETYKAELRELYKEQVTEIRWLPWWLHNRHVTVFVKDRRPFRAIYFERRLRASHIMPFLLSGADVDVAWDSFVAYWIKAEQYSKILPDVAIDRTRLETERWELIESLYPRSGREIDDQYRQSGRSER